MVVDRLRQVQLVNARASGLLGCGQALSVSHRRLACRQPAQDEVLGRLIEAACSPAPRGGAMRLLRDAAHPEWLVSVLPVPNHHDLATLLPEPLALVVIGDPAADGVPLDVCRSLFSLSAAEALLLAALARGSTVSDWARQRGVSLATARSQLRSLFEKTGTDSQARLVGLARAVPPVG